MAETRPIATTVRFDQLAHAAIAAEARQSGISFAQFVREAALMRATIRQITREYAIPPEYMIRLVNESERLVELARVDGAKG
jgi:mobilization protein NikA